MVKTYLDKSSIHGIGLFAGEYIPVGRTIYRPSPKLDKILTEEEFSHLSKVEKKTIKHYGYKTKDFSWHLAFDDIRFCNHSQTQANISDSSVNGTIFLTANRNILAGEELLQDYSEFEELRGF